MTPGEANLHEATMEAIGRPAACIDCGRLMRACRSNPNGMPQHAAYGLCNACYRRANIKGPGARELSMNLAPHLHGIAPAPAPTFEQQLDAMPSPLADYMLSRRRSGIPVQGLPFALWPANLRLPQEAPV